MPRGLPWLPMDAAGALAGSPEHYDGLNLATLDADAFGAYMRWVFSHWLNGGLPSDLAELAKIGGVTLPRLKSVWGRFEGYLILTDPGTFILPWMSQEAELAQEKRKHKGIGGNTPVKPGSRPRGRPRKQPIAAETKTAEENQMIKEDPEEGKSNDNQMIYTSTNTYSELPIGNSVAADAATHEEDAYDILDPFDAVKACLWEIARTLNAGADPAAFEPERDIVLKHVAPKAHLRKLLERYGHDAVVIVGIHIGRTKSAGLDWRTIREHWAVIVGQIAAGGLESSYKPRTKGRGYGGNLRRALSEEE